MKSTIWIVIFAYILFICSLFAIPFKRKRILDEAGQCLLAFPKKRIVFLITIEIVSAVLIGLVIFIQYTFFVTVILCACGVLGSWIIVGEAALGSKYGVYENGIIAIGKYISYDDIVTFPVLNLPKEEQAHYPDNVLVIASRKYGKLEIAFDSDDICSKVTSMLRKKCNVK